MSDFLSNTELNKILTILSTEFPKWNAPVVSFMAEASGTPYKVLIATLLSLRTKDESTHPAMIRLFKQADTPTGMLKLSAEEIEKLIYPVGFYHVKAKRIIEISKILLERYQGEVPDDIDSLLELPGVGRKTANLVMVLGFDLPGICVDVHVHRISNRWGYVQTKTPEKTEFELRGKLPAEWWKRYNDLLVAFGQTICKPVSPFCSQCPVSQYCLKIGVERFR